MARYSKDKLFFLPVRAEVREMDEVTLTEAGVKEAIHAALAKQQTLTQATAARMIDQNERPYMLQVVAWMCHAPEPNRNNEGFRPQDLELLAQNGLFQAPYFGAVDENHDFLPRGAWYSAEWAYDETAKQYGLLVKGAIWAWAYPEFADKLLRQQAEKGFLDFSMACFYKASEEKVWSDGRRYREIQHPIFVACSAITEGLPGDPNANGVTLVGGDWFDAHQVGEMLKARLTEADLLEETDMEELMQKIEALLGEQKAELQPLIDAVAKLAKAEEDLTAATATIQALTDEKTALEGTVAALTGEKETLEGTLATVTTEAATAAKGLEAAQATITDLTAEAESLRAFKGEIEAKEAEAAQAAKIEARKAEIPEVVMASLDLEKDEDKALFDGWMTQSDEQFEATKRTLSLASARKTHADRSAAEGELPGTAAKGEGNFAINRWRGRTTKKTK